MSRAGRDIMRKLATRVLKDPTSAKVADAEKLAAAVLILIDGKIP